MKNIIIRFLIYITGLYILAIGIAISIRSQSGVSPVSTIPIVFSEVTGKSVGTITFMFYFLCVILQIIILKKEYRARDLLQIIFSFVFGVFTDLALFLLQDLAAPNIFVQIMLFGISLVLISIGVFLIIVADIVMNAPEGLCIAISKKWNLKFSSVKSMFDLFCVIISVAVALLILGNLSEIKVGTVIAALFIGKMVGFLISKYSGKIKELYTEAPIEKVY